MATINCISVGCADTTVVQTTGGTVLVDCYRGSEFGEPGDDFAKYLPRSKRIEAVFITHQHRDHFAGLSYLQRHGYEIRYLVGSPYARRPSDASVTYEEWTEFHGYKSAFGQQGTKWYAPFRQTRFSEPWWRVAGIRIWVLGPPPSLAQSTTRELHDASLVLEFEFGGGSSCVFAGDASDANLQYIADRDKFGGDILHASHHGSLEGACLDFIKAASPAQTVISTKSGVHHSVPHPTAIERYKSHTSGSVYRTDASTWVFRR